MILCVSYYQTLHSCNSAANYKAMKQSGKNTVLEKILYDRYAPKSKYIYF